MSKIRKMKRAAANDAHNDALDQQVREGRTFLCECGCALPILWLHYTATRPDLRGVVAHIACPGCDRVYGSPLELASEGTESEITAASGTAGGSQDRIRCNVALGVNCTHRPSPLRVAA